MSFDYQGAIQDGYSQDQIVSYMQDAGYSDTEIQETMPQESTGIEFDYQGAVQDGYGNEQIKEHLVNSGNDSASVDRFIQGQSKEYLEEPEWLQEYSPEEQQNIQNTVAGYNQMNPDDPITYEDLPDNEGFFGGIREIARGLRSGLVDRAPDAFLRAYRNLGESYDPTTNTWVDRAIEEQGEDMAATIPSRKEASGNPSDLRKGASNVPLSLLTTLPGFAFGPVGGVLTSGALTGTVFYGSERDRFLEDVAKAYKNEHGEVPNKEEWQNIYNTVKDAATRSGAWEAGTEAAGAVFFRGLFGSGTGKAIGSWLAKTPGLKSKLGQTFSKIALNTAEELPAEATAEWGQSGERFKVGLNEEEKTWGESLRDIAGPTTVATILSGGGVQTAGAIGKKFSAQYKNKTLSEAQRVNQKLMGKSDEEIDQTEQEKDRQTDEILSDTDQKIRDIEALNETPEETPLPGGEPQQQEVPPGAARDEAGTREADLAEKRQKIQQEGSLTPAELKEYPELQEARQQRQEQDIQLRKSETPTIEKTKPTQEEILEEERQRRMDKSVTALEKRNREIKTKFDKPFRHEKAAIAGIKKANATETHEPVQVDDGWVGQEKAVKKPWEDAPAEREGDWYGTKVQVTGEKKTEYSGPATVTRVLNNGELIEAIPEGSDTAFRFNNNQIEIADLKESAPRKEETKKPEIKPQSTKKDPWEIAKGIARQGTDPQSSYGLYVKEMGLKPEMDAKEWQKIYKSVLPEVRAKQPASEKRSQTEQQEVEEIFINSAPKSDKGGTARTRKLAGFQENAPEGYETVFKPYGDEGRGYYYVPAEGVKTKQAEKEAKVTKEPWEMTQFEHKQPVMASKKETNDRLIAKVQNTVDRIGRERLENNRILKSGETIEAWLKRKDRQRSTWDRNRKTGSTGIQELSKKNLYGDNPEVEAFRKAALEYIKKRKYSGFNNQNEVTKYYDQLRESAKTHREAVKKALSEGKPVPQEVLKEYPELQEQAKVAVKPPITKEDIKIDGLDREMLPAKEWESILGSANIGYETDKRKTFKNSGQFILKDKEGIDTDTTYTWSVEKENPNYKSKAGKYKEQQLSKRRKIQPVTQADPLIEEAKKYKSADEFVEGQRSEQPGKAYRNSRSKTTPDNDMGYTMWSDSNKGLDIYGDTRWEADVTDLPHISEFIEEAKQKFEDDIESGRLSPNLEHLTSDIFDSEVDPTDVVNAAEAWDDPNFVEWFWENIGETNNIEGVKLTSGAILFDQQRSKLALNKSQLTDIWNKAQPRTIPEKDSDLTTIEKITDRIESIDRQRDKLEGVWNPKDWDKHHGKIVKLNNRKDKLWGERARMLKEQTKEQKPTPPAEGVKPAQTAENNLKRSRKDKFSGKSAHEMTLKEFDMSDLSDRAKDKLPDDYVPIRDNIPPVVEKAHRLLIKQAQSEGRVIPDTVFNDYPDLRPETTPEQKPTPEGKPSIKQPEDVQAKDKETSAEKPQDEDINIKEGKEKTIVTADIPKTEIDNLTPAEQKEYLLKEIDEAINNVVEENEFDAAGVALWEKGKLRPGGEIYSFKVPGDGEFKIVATELLNFKKKVKRSFPKSIIDKKLKPVTFGETEGRAQKASASRRYKKITGDPSKIKPESVKGLVREAIKKEKHILGSDGTNFMSWLLSQDITQKVRDEIKSIASKQAELKGTEKGAQYQTTITTPGNTTLSKAQIKKMFPGQGVKTHEDGTISVRFSNGNGIAIEQVSRISDADYEIAINSGRMSKNGKIAGKHVPGKIQLDINVADYGTLAHENFHELERIGVITEKEQTSLDFLAKKLIRKGTFKDQGSVKENRAEAFGQMMAGREKHSPAIRKLKEKILDFIDALVNIGRASARKLAVAVESGKVYERNVEGVGSSSVAYEQMAEEWRSQMRDTLDKKLNTAPAQQIKQQVKAWAKKGEFKQAELEWSGLLNWLDQQTGKVTKQNVLDYIDANQVQIEVVEKGAVDSKFRQTDEGVYERADGARIVNEPVSGEPNWMLYDSTGAQVVDGYDYVEDAISDANDVYASDMNQDTTKFSQYQESGGKNYKEILLTLPEKSSFPNFFEWKEGKAGDEDVLLDQYNKERAAVKGEQYTSSHFPDTPNILVHIRVNERTGPNGERVLFLEEVQGDWGQEGRKRGYAEDYTRDELSVLPDEDADVFSNPELFYFIEAPGQVYQIPRKKVESPAEAIEYVLENKKKKPGVPGTPFKDSKSWAMLAMKKMVRYAAENGFDSISWTTGETQAARYDLSKQVDSIEYTKQDNGKYAYSAQKDGGELTGGNSLNVEQLEEHIGKDITQKIVNSPTKTGMLSGLDLKVGGEGMKGFYDKILPAEVNKFFNKKSWGKAKVGETELSVNRDDANLTWDERKKHESDDTHPRMTAWSLPITDKMKSKALREGMPLFQAARGEDKNLSPEQKALDLAKTRNLMYKWARENLTGTQRPTLAWMDTVEDHEVQARKEVESVGGEYQVKEPTSSEIFGTDETIDKDIALKAEKEVTRIMGRLQKVGKKGGITVSEKKTVKMIKDYIKNREKLKDTNQDVETKIKEFKKYLMTMPENVRAKAMKSFPKLAKAKTPETREKYFKQAQGQTLQYLNDYFKRQTLKDIHKLRKIGKKQKANEVKKSGSLDSRGITFLEMLNGLVFGEGRDKQALRTAADTKEEMIGLTAQLFDAEARLKDATSEESLGIENEIMDLEDKIFVVETFGGFREMTLGELGSAYEALGYIVENGKTRRRMQLEEMKAETEKYRKIVAQETTGEESPVPETQAEKKKREDKEKNFVPRMLRKLSQYDTLHQSWRFLLDKATRKAGKKTLDTQSVEIFGGMAHQATNEMNTFNNEDMKQINEKLTALTGLKGMKLVKYVNKMSNEIDSYSKGQEDYKLAPLQAAYYWAVNKRADALMRERIPHLRERMDYHGYDKDFMKQIENTIPSELLDLSAWLSDVMGEKIYSRTNPIHEAVNGASLTHSRAYTPIWTETQKGPTEENILLKNERRASINKSALKNLTKNSLPIKPANLLDVWTDHIYDMNHYAAWALPTKQMAAVFSHGETRGFVEQVHGKGMTWAIDQFIENFKTGNQRRKEMFQAMERMRGNFATAVLGLNPTIYFKQNASIAAMAAEIPTASFAAGMRDFFKNPMKAIRVLDKSEFVKARKKRGHTRDASQAMAQTTGQTVGRVKGFKNQAMFLTRLGDLQAIYLGGWSVYRHFNKKYTKEGFSTKEAHKKAMRKFEEVAKDTQQSPEIMDRGLVEQGGALAKAFTMFMSAPAAYYRQVSAATRNFSKAPKDSTKRLALFWVAMPAMFEAIASAPLAFGDDDDKEMFMRRMGRSVVLGPVNGLIVAREVGVGIYNKLFLREDNWMNPRYSPLTEVPKNAIQIFEEVGEYMENGKMDYWEMFEAVNDVFGMTTGYPTVGARRLAEGVMDEETDHPVARAVGYGKYSTNE